MNRSLSFVLLATVSLALAAPARARSPEETLLAYVAAVQAEGLAASVRFTHSAELATFRAELEPEVAKRVKNSRTRPQFAAFADPYHPKQIRPFKDDADFVSVFIKWLSTSGRAGITTFGNATVTPLGTVTEGDLRHVVARFVYTGKERTGEVVSVTSMKMDAGQPMLTLPPELKSFADMVRQGR